MMNKKEQAAYDAIRLELAEAKALRWTPPIDGPDLAIPDSSNAMINGWLPVGSSSFYGRIEKACSNWANHSTRGWGKTTSQHPRALYSTRLLALQALRQGYEREFAHQLAKIDLEIEKERMNPTPGPEVQS